MVPFALVQEDIKPGDTTLVGYGFDEAGGKELDRLDCSTGGHPGVQICVSSVSKRERGTR